MKKRFIRSVSVLLALITALSCFSAVPFSAAEISDSETGSSGLKIGDVNADGVVNINDCTHLQKYLADLVELDDAQKKVADTNGDGKITILDATKIQKVIAKLDDFSVVTDETDEKAFTKGEWVSFIVDKFKMTKVTVSSEVGYHFCDIAGSQYAGDIETAYAYGILPAVYTDIDDFYDSSYSPYSTESSNKSNDPGIAAFEPDAVATREFAAVTVYNAMGFQGTLPCDLSDEADITYFSCAATMINQGFMTAKNNCFLPDSPVTESDKKTISERIDYYKSREKVDKSEEKCDYEFTDNVVTITGEADVSEVHIDDDDDNEDDNKDKKYCVILPKTKEALSLEVGSVFSLPVSEANPQGGVFKVLEIEKDASEDMVYFLCKSPELEEAFEYIDIAATKEADFGNIETAPGVTLVEANGSDSGAENGQSGKTKGAEPVGAVDGFEYLFEIEASKISGEKDIIDLGDTKLRVAVYEPRLELDTRYLYDDSSFKEFLLALSYSAETSIMVIQEQNKETGSTGIDIIESLKSKEFVLGTFPVAVMEPTIFANVTVFLFADIYGRVRVGARIGGKAGIECSNGQRRNISEFILENPVAEINATAQAGVGLRVVLSFLLFDFAGVDIKPGLGVTAKAVVHLDRYPTMKCYDCSLYFSLVIGVTEGTALYGILDELGISLYAYIFTEDYSPLLNEKFHCETTGSEPPIFAKRIEECTYTTDVGRLLVDFQKPDGSKLTIGCLRLYDEDGELVKSEFNAGNNLYINNLNVGRYHIEAFSVDGDSNYYADANVDVKKNQTVKCTLTGAVRRVPGKGSLCVTCVAESSGQQLEVTAITLYDNNNTQIITCKGNPFTFDNVPKGLYYVEVNATKNGVKYYGTSYKVPVSDGQKTSFTFEVPKRVKKEAEKVPKIESKKVTFSYDRSMFKDPCFDIIISKNPIDPDYDYITTDSTWWFYYTYQRDDGWYYQDALNGWRYITDESLDPGTYYLALFIREKDNEEQGDEKIEVRIPFGVETVNEKVLFRFKVNPDNGQVIYDTDTRTPVIDPPSISV